MPSCSRTRGEPCSCNVSTFLYRIGESKKEKKLTGMTDRWGDWRFLRHSPFSILQPCEYLIEMELLSRSMHLASLSGSTNDVLNSSASSSCSEPPTKTSDKVNLTVWGKRLLEMGL
jgi:hypothetical protein